MLKRFIAVAACFCGIIVLSTNVVVAADTIADAGFCSDTVDWCLYEDGTLEISGSGDIPGYSDNYNTPWWSNDIPIEHLVIKTGITSIGEKTFKDHTALKSVSISEGVEAIGKSAFLGCTNLADIRLPSTLATLGPRVFAGCSALESISLPSKVTAIEANTFMGCTSLRDVVLPSALESIGSYAFEDCTALATITFPNGIQEIDSYAFNRCGLTKLILPEGITTIRSQAFLRCESLRSVFLPNSLTTLGGYVFDGCPGLTTAGPATGNYDLRYAWTDELPDNAFSGCDYLTQVVLPNDIKAIPNGAFNNCKLLSSISIPSSVATVGRSAFYNCHTLKSIIVPEGVTKVGYSAFAHCKNLEFIVLPKSLEELGHSLLDGSNVLQTVYYLGDESDWANISINNYNNLILTSTERVHIDSLDEIYTPGEKGTVRIEIENMPDKLSVKKDSTFDKTGMIVIAHFSDNTTSEILDYDVTYDFSALGEKYVTVTYDGKTASFWVEVTPFDGSGTSADPYIIETKEQLNDVRNYIHSDFKLTNDLVFTSADFSYGGAFYNGGSYWLPIGLVAFYGTFDGNNHSIQNIKANIKGTESTGAALFTENRGTIKNLRLIDCNLNVTTTDDGYAEVGCIAQSNRGTIENCFATGTITAGSEAYVYAGGLVGSNTGIIQCSYSNVDIDVTYEFYSSNSYYNPYAGGIAGSNSNEIKNCYSIGDISVNSTGYYAYAYAGGIAAENLGTIESCYSRCNVQVATMGTKASVSYVGGVVGRHSGGSVGNCYFLDVVEQGVGHGNGTEVVLKCTDSQMKQQATYVGFDFDSIWTIYEHGSYPYPELVPCGACKHSFSTKPSAVVVSEATCTDAAIHYVSCDNCDEVSVDTTISVGEPLGHDWADWEGNDAVSHTRTCKRGCNTAETDTHQWIDVCAGHTHYAKCYDCGKETPYAIMSSNGEIITITGLDDTPDGLIIFAALYDNNGKIIATQQGNQYDAIGNVQFHMEASQYTAKVFLLYENYIPWNRCITILPS